jgi:4-hydroxybenzoate polyprenyltransferase
MRLDKPVGILLLLWPTLWALWIAGEGHPDLDVLIIFIFGVIVMRSTGCVINDLADRNLDRHVQRTRHRPITSGKVKPIEAMGLTTVLLMCALVLVLNLNDLTFKLSLVAVPLAIIYPFMKRFTYLPQVFLGLAFAWAIPMAFAAQTNSIPEIAWLLFITTVLWAVVYDTMYAMVDREDDIKIGVKTTAILFDDADRTIIASVQVLILLSQILAGSKLELGRYYYAGIAIASLLSIYQQYLIKDRIPENCFRAFMNNQWYGMVVFVGLYLHYMFG